MALLLLKLYLSLCFHQNLRKMEDGPSGDPGRDLNELQNADWVHKQSQLTSDLQSQLII